ncbi:neuronal calcium sensor 1 [Sarotherodon galilaeus]
MLSMTVDGTELPFLVDTGATYSTLRDTPDCATLSSSTVSVVGFSGIPMTLPLTDPALTQLGKQTLKHQYVVSPQVPVNLMGRDLLVKLGATIMCSADGLTVTLPGGKEFPCLGSPSKTQYLVRDSEQSTADIYWGRLVEEGILRTYQQWRPWIMSLAVYSEPRDPYHVTLFYDKEEDDTYREQFESDLEGETWKVKTHNIYIGPEGVAAAVKLTDEQLPWYNVGEDSAPHITLAVHVGHKARELGPMVKRALDNSWWQEHKEISRTHGREKTDHPDAVAELPKLPDTLWSRGPTDVGLASCSPVLFELKSDAPINKPQYRHKPEADAGIAETIEGLLQVEEKVREDLKAEPIAGAEEWFTDGCCHRDEEGLKAGYAVVRRVGQEYQVIEAGRIEGQQSAQRAEVIALIRALRLAKNLKVNIYTDSAYAFGAAHVELAQWKRTGYRTATNAPICHKKEMEELEKALEDPDEVSIVKCKGHSQGDNPVARGNQTADEAAKKAAGFKGQRQMVQVTAEEEVSTNTLEEVRQAQKEAAPEEKGVWQAKGAWQEEGLWRSPDGRPVLTTKMAKQKSTGFTPYELLTGRQFPAPWTVVSAEQPQKRNRSHAEYFNELKALVSSFTKQVTCEKPREKGEVPDAKAVWLKVIKRKWKEPRWTGPYEVTARTATAVQLRGKGDTWFHWTQCAAADESLVDEDPAPPDTGGNESKRQNKSSPLCNGPIGSLPERPKQEEPLRRRSPRLQKGATTN